MCDRCQELDEKIERYRRIAWAINDQRTVDKLVEMIAGMEAQKAALHPEQK
jgi:flagellar motility protein MotE (MotC chaperone)